MESTILLQPGAKAGKFRLKGLTKKQIEFLKANKGNIAKITAGLGGTAALTGIIRHFVHSGIEEVVTPQIEELAAKIDANSITPEEILNIIDIDDTISTFEALEID